MTMTELTLTINGDLMAGKRPAALCVCGVKCSGDTHYHESRWVECEGGGFEKALEVGCYLGISF